MENEVIHYGMEYGDLTEFGINKKVDDYVLLICRRFNPPKKINLKYCQDWKKVTCKRCLNKKNRKGRGKTKRYSLNYEKIYRLGGKPDV